MKLKNEESGLTLIEALVSVLILSLGLIPLFSSITSAINLSSLIKNTLIASNLAQEGAEVARSIRDSNWFNGAPYFYTNLADCGLATCDWRFEWNSTVPLPISSNPYLKFDPSTGLYNYSTGNDTGFTRKISISKVGSCDCEIKIISEVDWQERGAIKKVIVESHLFNWK